MAFASGPKECTAFEKAADDLRALGNACFKQGKWSLAVEHYSASIQHLKPHQDNAVAHQNGAQLLVLAGGDGAAIRASLALAYSNRAEANLRLKENTLACKDAHMAWQLHPQHSKSLLRLAKACNALEWYQLAVASCRKCLETDLTAGERVAVQTLLEQAERKDGQTRLGIYRVDKYFLELEMTSVISTAPPSSKCCDFVGPLEIKRNKRLPRSGFGTGRGLFATRDVKEGDLLCACSPLAVVTDVDQPAQALAQQLSQALESPLVRFQIMTVLTGSDDVAQHFDEPPMTIFRPSNALISSQMVCNFFHGEWPSLPHAAGTPGSNNLDVAFHDSDLLRAAHRMISRKVLADGRLKQVSGVWVLPSFRNHSCVPNSHEAFVGHTIFVRACRDIAKGEEVTTAYNEICIPLEPRRAKLMARFDDPCTCQRCSLEEALLLKLPALVSLSKECCNYYQKIVTYQEQGVPFKIDLPMVMRVHRDLENILQQRPCLQLVAERKNWIRASFQPLHRLMFMLYTGNHPQEPDWMDAANTATVSAFKDTGIHTLVSVQPANEAIMTMLHAYLTCERRPCGNKGETKTLVFRIGHCIFGSEISDTTIWDLFNNRLPDIHKKMFARLG